MSACFQKNAESQLPSLDTFPGSAAANRRTTPAKRFWNWYAKVYGSVENLEPHKTMLKDVTDLVPANARRILDVGCGSGALLDRLRLQRPVAELHGVDFSTEMLSRAQKRVPGINTYQADLNCGLQFDDNQFDCIVSTNAIYAFDNPNKAILEMLRISKPDGLLVLSSPKREAKGTKILREHLKNVSMYQGVIDLAKFATCLLPNILIERLARKNDYHFFTKAEFLNFSGQVKLHNDTFAGQNWLFTIAH